MKNTETMYIYNQYLYGTEISLFWMKDDHNAMRWFVLIHIIDLAIDYPGTYIEFKLVSYDDTRYIIIFMKNSKNCVVW